MTPTDPFTLRFGDRTLDVRPHGPAWVMGILNVTPDSFSDGGAFTNPSAALRHAEQMLNEGATFLDVGGESTRPRGRTYGAGAAAVDADEERRRVLPVIEAICKRFPHALVSIDTYKPDVAREALAAGAALVNDITGLRWGGDRMATVCADAGAPLVVMHSVGTPGAMPHAEAHTDVLDVVRASLAESVATAEQAGVEGIVVDPGFGFGKTVEENLRLMSAEGVGALLELGRPVLVGISRKSTIGAVLGTSEVPAAVPERLYGTLGATAAAVLGGASVVRTHDVKPTVELLRVLHAVRQAQRGEVAV